MCSFLVIFIPSDRFRPTLRAHITSINSSISRFISIYFLVSGANSEKLQPEILTRKFNKRNEWKMFTLLQRGKIKKIKHQTRKKKRILSASQRIKAAGWIHSIRPMMSMSLCVCPRLKPKLLARFNLVKCTQFQMICLVTIMTGWKCRVAESTKKKTACKLDYISKWKSNWTLAKKKESIKWICLQSHQTKIEHYHQLMVRYSPYWRTHDQNSWLTART